jgi:hypothetical protein
VGGVEALIKGVGGDRNLFSGKNLESALKGALASGKEQGKEADFRDVTAKVTGTADSPSASLVKVGPSSRQAQDPKIGAPAADKPAKTEEIIKEKIIDTILPSKNTLQPAPVQQTRTGQTQSSPSPQPESDPGKTAEKKIEEQVENEIRKGIDSLFKRKK